MTRRHKDWARFRQCSLVAAAVCILALLPACTGSEAGRELERGELVRIGFSSGPIDLDPHANSEEVTNNICFHLFDSLVFLDHNLKVIPWVASSWQNPTPVTWVFTIRSGIRFHDGTPLTAADVVYSIERIRAMAKSPKKPFLLAVKSVRAVGADEVEIVTYEPYMPLLIKMSQIMVVPEAYYRRHPAEYLKAHPLGSGPYRPLHIDFERQITLEAVPGHWRGPQSFRKVRFEFIGDETARTDRLLAGELDLIKEPSLHRDAALRQAERFHRVDADGMRLVFIGLTYRATLTDGAPNPFRDKDVRQAIHLAIDRSHLCRDPLASMAKPAGQLVPSLIFGYTPGLDPPPHAPERGRRILASKDFPFGRTFTAQYPVDKYFRIRETAEACARQLAAIGVKIRLVPVPARTFIPTVAENTYDIFFCGWSAITGDTSDFFENCFHSRGEDNAYGFFNPAGYNNPQLDALIETSTRLPRRETRLVVLQRIMGVCMEELIWIPLYFLKDSYAYRRDLEFHPRIDRYVLLSDLKPRP